MKKFLFLFVLFLVLLQSCTTTNPPASTGDTLPVDWPIPAPTGSTAVIYGRLLSSANSPVMDMIFLSENLAYDRPDLPPTFSFSFQNSPRAIVDVDRGYFYFENVEPAPNYVITVLIGPGEFFYVMEADGETPKLIAVEAGDSLDLGTLTIDIPEYN